MFALLNPPRRGRKGKAKRLKRRKGRKAAAKRVSSIFTPGGGRIFKIAANRPRRRNSFLGVNPFSRLAASFKKGVTTMARGRRGRRNGFSFSAPRSKGIFDALKPTNLVGVAPLFVGVIGNGLAQRTLASVIPYTKRGLGSILLGVSTAGLLGMLGRYASKAMGDGIFVGGLVGTLGCAVQDVRQGGLMNALRITNMGDFSEPFGMGNFTSPGAIANAFQSEGTIGQYSLPNSNAQFIPQPGMQMPQTPAQGQQARQMSDYEGSAIGAMLGQDDVGGII